MAQKTITALMVAPGMNPCKISLYQNQDFLKAAVSIGLEDTVGIPNFLRLNDRVGILYAQYAVLWNGKPNRKVKDRVLAGTFYVVGTENKKLSSLSPDDLKRYRKEFWKPLDVDSENDLDYLNAKLDALFSLADEA